MKNDKRDDEHTHAMNKITEYILYNLLDPAREHEEVNENVVRHISQCAQCIEELDTMSTFFCDEKSSLKKEWKKLFELVHKESVCGEYCSNLAEYVDDKLDGIDVKEEHFSLWLHLQSCHSCNERYTTLKSMAKSELQEERVAAAAAPFELRDESVAAAERTEQQKKSFWKIIKETAGEKVRRLIKEIKVEFKPGKIAFPDFPSFLTSPVITTKPAPVYRYKQEEQSNPIEATFIIYDEDLDLESTFVWYLNSEGNVDFIITIKEKKTQEIPKNIFVLLKSVEKGCTGCIGGGLDNEGKRVFQNLKHSVKYTTEVEYKGETLAIPLNL